MLSLIGLKFSNFRTQLTRLVSVIVSLGLIIGLQVLPANALSIQPMATIGARHQLEGAVDQAAGKVQQQVGQAQTQTKGFATEAKGKAKRDIGRVESTANSLKRKTANAADDSKNALSKLGDKIQDKASDIADSVKDLVK